MIVQTRTVAPAAHCDPENPPAVTVICAVGFTPWRASFHARRSRRPPYIAEGTESVMKVPMRATPVLPVLKPPACAPTTALSIPP